MVDDRGHASSERSLDSKTGRDLYKALGDVWERSETKTKRGVDD